MSTNANNIKNFPTERLNRNWPFSLKLAEDLSKNAFYVDSLKAFFLYMEFGGVESEPLNLETENYSWSDFSYNYFCIEKGALFFQDDLKGPKYLLDGIPYNHIVCEAFRCYINNELKKNQF